MPSRKEARCIGIIDTGRKGGKFEALLDELVNVSSTEKSVIVCATLAQAERVHTRLLEYNKPAKIVRSEGEGGPFYVYIGGDKNELH